MKNCKDCGKEVSNSAKQCPNCGAKLKKIRVGVVLSILIITVGSYWFVNNTDYLNDYLDNNEADRFTLLDGHSGKADSYGISYTIKGTIQNNTSKNYSYVQVQFNVYDKDDNDLGSCLANNNNFEANGKWLFEAICFSDAEKIKTYKLMEITGW